jgi:ribosome-associated protein
VLQQVYGALVDRKATDVLALDMRKVTIVADYFVLATGNSRLHVQSLADAVAERLKAAGRPTLRREGYGEARWICIDYGDVVVHLFQAEVRRYFDLERLWSDAPRMDLSSSPP